jgi:hypothetical protein
MIVKRVVAMMALPVLLSLTACEPQEPISYSKDVRPLLDQFCLECHTVGKPGEVASGFSMETYTALMKGTRYGAMVIPGDAMGSNLVVLIEGRADPSINMPHGQEKQLSEAQIQTIRNWIDQGAKDN